MKLHKFVLVGLIVGLATISSEAVVAQRGNPIAQLLRAERVEVKSNDQPRYAPAYTGQLLYYGDLLRVRPGGSGTVRCLSDSTEWAIPDDGLSRGVANTCS